LTLTNLSSPIICVPTNCQIFSITPFVHVNPTIKKLKLKNKNPGLPTHCHLFSYITRETRDKERKKKELRETEEIKIEI
jgi:hypothetical protein